MDQKCPFCGADTRPGDNFCLNCGSRLSVTTPSSSGQQAPTVGEETEAVPDQWPVSETPPWAAIIENAAASSSEPTAYHPEPAFPGVQATMDKISQPSRFLLRSEQGEILQEFTLDKYEISIGRAPNSDILLSKDKLTSRRHAVVLYQDDQYLLRDEHSANGTFVNGQQLEDDAVHILKDSDHVGIGEHELVYRLFGAPSIATDIEELPTVAVPYDSDFSYQTQADDLQTIPEPEEDFSTREDTPAPVAEAYFETPAPEEVVAPVVEEVQVQEPEQPEPEMIPQELTPPPPPVEEVKEIKAAVVEEKVSEPLFSDDSPNFYQLTSLSQPAVPDMTPLLAALSSLDGQVMALQQQLNATQESVLKHQQDVEQSTAQLRKSVQGISDRMDNTISEVARSRETLAWAELLQLMEDVMNNPRDIEYVTKLARKARELNKVFLLHQNVLNTMAECNSLLRGLIGEGK